MLVVERVLGLIEIVSLVDADIKHVPSEAVRGTLKLPVAENVRQLVAVANGVVGWADAAVLTDVDSHETESLILRSAVLGTTSNERLNCATQGHRASKRCHEAQSVGILPQSALAERSKIVEGALLVEVVVEHELTRWHEMLWVRVDVSIHLLDTRSNSVGHGGALQRVEVRHVLKLSDCIVLE